MKILFIKIHPDCYHSFLTFLISFLLKQQKVFAIYHQNEDRIEILAFVIPQLFHILNFDETTDTKFMKTPKIINLEKY